VSCPRCGRATLATLSFCTGCGAPLALRDDPPPRALDAALPLDRRTPARGLLVADLEPELLSEPDSEFEADPGLEPPELEPDFELVPAVGVGLAAPLPRPPARTAERSHWNLGASALAAAADRFELSAPATPALPLPASLAEGAEPALPVSLDAPAVPPQRAVPSQRYVLDVPEPKVEELEIHLRRASTGRRALAWAIDVIPFAAAVGALARSLLVDPAGVLPSAPGLDGVLDLLAREAGIVVPLAVLLVVALFVYATLAHALAGATLGKWMVGVRLAGPDGRRPSMARSAARSTLAVLSAGLLGLGFLAALFTRSGRALHDVAAGTCVVEA
jgi:uncharacterized RDD family membrane protein YckC